jgi:hypothetical protein
MMDFGNVGMMTFPTVPGKSKNSMVPNHQSGKIPSLHDGEIPVKYADKFQIDTPIIRNLA